MSYETLIASCTPGQRDAIMRTDEPAFIMAGAGTGKTFTLSRKLAFGMCDEENDDPSRFMAITFTEAAAAELMDRARASARMSGSKTADEIEALQNLYKDGYSKSTLAKVFGYSRNTINKYLN